MNRTLLGTFLLLAAVCFGPGCNRQKAPSAEYREAHQRFSKLYAAQLDDAFLDPQMAEVEALLTRVPESSLDHQNAQQLLTRIREGRARMEAAVAEREKAQQLPPPTFDRAGESGDAPARPAAPAEPPDAGLPTAPVRGMPLAQLQSLFGACLDAGPTIDVGGRGERQTFQLRAAPGCRERLPTVVGHYVLIEEGKVLGLLPEAQVKQEVLDGGR